MKYFNLNKQDGFSLVELMVVVIILGGLTALAMPRLRQFIAQGRQAEAKNLLAQIHTLQVAYQNSEDKFARWANAQATTVGYKGTCSPTAVASNTPPGAYELGFKPQNCDQLRYGYWVLHGTDADGKEGYLAVAYAPSDTTHRIFPTCDGQENPTRATKVENTRIGVSATGTDGDWQSVDEDKVWGHDDIVESCK